MTGFGLVILAASLAVAAPSRRRPAIDTDLGRGVLLVARRSLVDPSFASTVVLLLDYGSGGARGLVVNRPSQVDLASLLPNVEGLESRQMRLYYGGPVARGKILLLFGSSTPPPGSTRVLPDVHVSGSLQALEQALRSPTGDERVRAYAGHAGWGPGQLDREVARNDWHVVGADSAVVFDGTPADLWQRLIDSLTGLWTRAAPRGAGPPLLSPRDPPPAKDSRWPM